MRLGSRCLTIASARSASFTLLQGPLVAGVVDAVDHVRVHVLAVAGGVVAHRVHHDRRMVLGRADVELRMAGVAVVPVGVGGLPLVVTEVRLREGDEHPHVVRRPQDLREAQVRAGLAAVVVGVDEIDAEALEALQALAGGVIGGQRRSDLGVVQRQSAEKDAGAVEVEIPALDPELAKAEAHRPADIQHPAPGVQQRDLQLQLVLRRVNVPELLGHPFLRERDAAFFEIARLERPAREFLDDAAVLPDACAKGVLCLGGESFDRRIERDLLLAHRGVHPHVGDMRPGRRAHQVDVAAQAAPSHRALDLAGRGAVGVREHDALERHGDHEQTEPVRAAGTTHRR